MHRRVRILAVIMVCLSLSGCRLISGGQSQGLGVEEKLMNMDSYAASLEISHMDNGEKNTYQAKQLYQIDGNYRFEVIKPDYISGLTTIYNGEKIIQYNPNVDEPKLVELADNEFRNQIFLGSFIKNYLQSQDVSIEVQNIEGATTTVLEAIIPGGSKHMASQKLWLDHESKKPVTMIIYNEEGQETVIIKYGEFTYNPKIDQSIFTIEK